MQDIQQETLNECTKTEQSALIVLWEIDLTEVGGDRYFFCPVPELEKQIEEAYRSLDDRIVPFREVDLR